MGAEQAKSTTASKQHLDKGLLASFAQLFHNRVQVEQLVQNFSTNNREWPEFANQLEIFNKGPPGCCNTELDNPIHAGSSGKIYDAGSCIVKRIPIAHAYNIRGVFLECLIQTILGADPEYGHHIPKIFSIKRSSNTKIGDLSIYITMEKIKQNFHEKFGDVGQITLPTILPYFKQLALILQHFDTKYKFRHRDLHTGNIMFNGDTLYLIDFGRASFGDAYFNMGEYYTLNRELRFEKYSTLTRWDGVLSFSPPFDILVFVACVKEYYYSLMDAECQEFITNLIGHSLYEYMDQMAKQKEQVFSQGYAYKIKEWSETYRRFLNNNPHLTIPGFREAVDDTSKVMRGESLVNLHAVAYAPI